MWSGVDTLFRQAFQFAFGVVLARLLAPEAFGLFAILTFFTAVGGLIADGGFGTALIQRSKLLDSEISSVFWFNVLIGTLLATLLAATAPLIAAFYRQPQLIPLTWAMAANIWLMSLITVQRALLTRKFDFRSQAVASMIATVFAGTVAVVSAFWGAGAWALVIQALCSTLATAVVLWWLHPWRPSRTFAPRQLGDLFRYGGYVMAAGVLDAFASRLYTVLIGKFQSTRALGYFSQAHIVKDFPQDTIGNLYGRLVLPIFSRSAGEPEALRVRFRDAQLTVMAVNLPVMLGLAATAETLIALMLGPKWLPSVPLLQVLCGVGATWPMQIGNLTLLLAAGQSRRVFWLEVIKKGAMIALVVLASQWGVVAIAWSILLSAVLALFVNAWNSGRIANYSLGQQLLDVLPYAILAGIMAMVVSVTDERLEAVILPVRLMLDCLVGFTLYIGGCQIFGLHAYRRIGDLVRGALFRR